MNDKLNLSEEMYEREWSKTDRIFVAAKVMNGVCVDAWTYQIDGNFKSSGGALRQALGKTVPELEALGFRKRTHGQDA